MKLSENARKMISEGRNFASLSTLMPDGSPQVSTIWVDLEGDNVVFNTSEGRLKTNNVRREPRVALCVVNSENPYQQVLIRGRVIEMTHEGAIDHINRLAKKYMGADKYPYLQPDEQRVIVKIAPEHVSG